MVRVLRRFPSLSRPGEERTVYLDDDERVGCTCPGWKSLPGSSNTEGLPREAFLFPARK